MTDNNPTLTVGQLRALLADQPDDRPVIVYDDGNYLNLVAVEGDESEIAVVITTVDNYDPRQW